MPQMFPMNWWLISLMPFLMILMNMMFMQHIYIPKKNKTNLMKSKMGMMNWKW